MTISENEQQHATWLCCFSDQNFGLPNVRPYITILLIILCSTIIGFAPVHNRQRCLIDYCYSIYSSIYSTEYKITSMLLYNIIKNIENP